MSPTRLALLSLCLTRVVLAEGPLLQLSAFPADGSATVSEVRTGETAVLDRDDSYLRFVESTKKRARLRIVLRASGAVEAYAVDAYYDPDTFETPRPLWRIRPPAGAPGGAYRPYAPAISLRDVATERSRESTESGETWRSVLLVSYGGLGRGYLAVDVSEPTQPALLWWRGRANRGPDALPFGSVTAPGRLGTVFIRGALSNPSREVGVAFLPGGSESGPGTARAARATVPPLPEGTRPETRAWPDAGKMVAVVRIDNGETLAVFAPKALPLPALKAARAEVPFTAPISQLAVWPTATGTVSRTLFLGDMEGTTWRLDLTSPDPAQWAGQLWLDGYSSLVTNELGMAPSARYAAGQPVRLPMLVSRGSGGEPIVTFVTGATEDTPPSAPSFVYSAEDRFTPGPDPGPRAKLNYYLPLGAGERVDAASIFDNALYFSTFSAGSGTERWRVLPPRLPQEILKATRDRIPDGPALMPPSRSSSLNEW